MRASTDDANLKDYEKGRKSQDDEVHIPSTLEAVPFAREVVRPAELTTANMVHVPCN